MIIVVSGSRSITNYHRVKRAIETAIRLWEPRTVEIMHGDCPTGVDRLAQQYAESIGLTVYKKPAEWDAHGKAAGPIRNGLMAVQGDALVAVWDGVSRGTKDMIQRMQAHGKPTYVDKPEGPPPPSGPGRNQQ